jgi:hypothetical protein
MNSHSPTQDQLASFQAQISSLQQFMASIQPAQHSAVQPQAPADSSLPGPTPIMAISAPPSAASPAGMQPSQPQPISVPLSGPVTPYQSARTFQSPTAASQGHPSVAGVSASATQPFLGFNNIGVDLAGQVNQARLASSAATQPRRAPDLQPRRSRRPRGAAVAPPSLDVNSRPDARRCVTEVFPANGPAYSALKLLIKVYLPQVCALLFRQSHH